MKYNLPALVGPHEGKLLTENKLEPAVEVPAIVNAKKLNTVIWSVLVGTLLYIVLRLVLRKRVSAALQPLVKNTNSDLLDEIGYRSIAIGFPVFTLGALIFAMIWAQIAWTRFWGWDPKRFGTYHLALLCGSITFTPIKRMAWREVSSLQ